MALATNIKAQIKTILDAAKTAGELGEVIEDDYKTDIWQKDIATYPAALLSVPSIEGQVYTNQQNTRIHTFEVLIVMKGEDIASATDVETLMEQLLDRFDNDQTLGGNAPGGLDPSSTMPAPVTTGDKSYIVFSIILKAKAIKELT